MDSPLHVEPHKLASPFSVERQYEYSFSTTLAIREQFVRVRDDSVVAPGTGATANLVGFKWPYNQYPNQNSYLRKVRFLKVPRIPRRLASNLGMGELAK